MSAITHHKKRVLSGIQPTGNFHLGNYIGAMHQWLEWQETSDALFCIVDLHMMTIPENFNPKLQRARNRQMVAIFLACGIDPKKSSVFIQSHIREHAELGWILTCVTPLGWLERMTQFKSKAENLGSIGSGLLQYPVLQAADILLYETDFVPVGEDQKQHIELTCDIAQRFNHLFGPTFKIPKVVIRESGARIMGLDDPTVKMSKSIGEKKAGHMVSFLDNEKTIKKAVMSAVTDSGQEFRPEHASAGVINLLSIYQVLTQEKSETIQERFAGKGYGHLKKDVFEAVWALIEPIQQRYLQITADSAHLEQIIADGANRVRPIAEQVMNKVRDHVGLG